jgi:F0F1-type ATP synthase epsilon subunit
MKLTIISFQEKLTFDIAWLEITTTTGNRVVQKGHVPMIAQLAPRTLVSFCLQNGKQESKDVAGGMVHIERTSVTIVIDS